ncbi:uncharacterized protein LOC110109164 [Dendrobium catenatum]|uniref:uncharacterized protein LOC110109164 n=1 Tax=Dendrobium catenatum TaxID=906689 RepID=UPI0009F70E07|nr:uncharacterized protein LOC110109164 [Dendrobium catenatum]
MRGLIPTSPHLWIILGDFNCCRFANEKAGGIELLPSRLGELNNFIFDGGVHDFPSVGLFYTLSNLQISQPIHIKLDRMLVNVEFLYVFPQAYYNILPTANSDHSPLVLLAAPKSHTPRRFLFKNYWIHMVKLKDKDRSSSHYLSKSILEFKSKHHDCLSKSKHHDCLLALQNQPLDSELNNNLKTIKEHLIKLQASWASWISQRAKEHWLSKGEDDLGFLYAKIRSRANLNMIREISFPWGHFTNHKDIVEVLILHCTDSFNAPKPLNALNFNIPSGKVIPDSLLPTLLAPFSNDEIKEAIFPGHSFSAPGPDGFTFAFYKLS